MKPFRRFLAKILILSILCGMLPLFQLTVRAATVPINISVVNYAAGTLNFRWDALPGTRSVEIIYHTPDSSDNGVLHHDPAVNQTTNTASVSGLKNDYIYDIYVRVYDGLNGTGNLIGEGLLYYQPQMSFSATQLAQSFVNVDGGGREIGSKPGLHVRWVMPKVWYSGSGRFEYLHDDDVLQSMENRLNAIYMPARDISSVNFRINISTDARTLNSGSQQTSVLINYSPGEKAFLANASGSSTTVSAIGTTGTGSLVDGSLSFDLLGRADNNEPLPAVQAHALPHPDIFPGTVYYMNIKPVFKNASGDNVNVITVGNPEDQNGSKLLGVRDYTFTPIRFQLTKDEADNIYVKIYKINQGSLDLPRLFYEVQAGDDSSIPGDWPVKKTMDDSYFSGDYAITVLTGINPNNEVFYKVVVKSDSPTDRLESLPLPYTLAIDLSRPPVPMKVAVVDRKLVTRTSGSAIEKSTDVTISWGKPANWDFLKNNTDPAEDIIYYFLLNTMQNDMDLSPDPPLVAEGKNYGSFDPKYRLVKYVTIKSADIKENGNRLEYTLKGFDLFTGEYYTGGTPTTASAILTNPEGYPNFLLPNKTYYIHMYTTKGSDRGTDDAEKMSNRSVVAAFTTLSGSEQEVPLIKNFKVNRNDADVVKNPTTGEIDSISNYIEMQFGKVDIKWENYTSNQSPSNAVYYDLYMSTRTEPDSFTLIGSTQDLSGDVDFLGQDAASTIVRATVRNFSSGSPAYTRFGAKLLPNTTYYFYVKTRLHINGEAEDRVSIPTAILAVTTVKGSIQPPGENDRAPVAPTDFAIAEDEEGNLRLTGTDVALDWSRKENDVVYELICTSERVAVNADISSLLDDPVYQKFMQYFKNKDYDSNDYVLTLDPAAGASTRAEGFSYIVDPKTGTATCIQEINNWLSPNTLYYFSLRARLGNNTSVWVSIPVTTVLIEAPVQLQAVHDCEIGFDFSYTAASAIAEDFYISMKGPSDGDYKPLTRSQFTIVKDGTRFYVRVFNLKANSSYNFKVYRNGSSLPVFEKTGATTRDDWHQIEVKWMGNAGYDYEIAIKTEADNDYITLNKDMGDYELYVEKTPQTAGTNYNYYYARIKTVKTVLPGGNIVYRPLKSNTKYYIKVRSIKWDNVNGIMLPPSKYVGPVNTRTEFNQSDYDREDREEKGRATFLDRMRKLEEGIFWRVAMNNPSATRVLLKGDRIANSLENSVGNELVVDISGLAPEINTDVIYIPVELVRTLKDKDKSLTIRTVGGDFTFQPRTLDPESLPEITSVLGKPGVKDLFVKVTVTRSNKATGLPASSVQVSWVNDFEMMTMGLSKSYAQLGEIFHDTLYNTETGLVNSKLNLFLNATQGAAADEKVLNEYINQLAVLIEKELSTYVDYQIQISTIQGMSRNVRNFSGPMGVKLTHTGGQGLKAPYVQYSGVSSGQKLSNNTVETPGYLAFNVTGTGKYIILSFQSGFNDIPQGYWAKEYIDRFTAKYDLSNVFTGIQQSLAPENIVSGKELVLLYEVVMEKTAENIGQDIKQKVKSLELADVINVNSVMRAVSKQESAAVLLKLYSAKMGVRIDSLLPGRNIYIHDEGDIGNAYYKPVVLSIDLGLLDLNDRGNFLPLSSMTRAQVIAAFVKTLELTDDL